MNRITRMLADTTSRVLFRDAEVTAVTDHGGSFRAIELTGDTLRKATWTVGDKVQIRTDPAAGLTLRAYTPFRWDTTRGSTTLLAYAHGTGPGSTWVRDVAPGASCEMFGPRGSLELDDLPGPILFVGDETSFALAGAWRRRNPEDPMADVFEVTDPDECRVPLDAIGLRSARLFQRESGSAHLGRLSATVVDLLRTNPDASLCLTGKAQSIASIRRALKASDLAGRPVRVKAYWDENRSGLD